MMQTFRKFFGTALTSLRYRNIQFYCAGAMVSLVGSMMQESMVAWIAYQITGSTAVLGNIMSFFMLPMIAGSIAGGYVADRFNRKRVVIITQICALGIATSYMLLAATGALSIGAIYALSAVFGVIVAFEMSSRLAMLAQLVDKPEHIGNAFALDSLIFYSSRLTGPALGAFFLVATGPVGGFAANVVSYIIELWTLTKLKPNPGGHEKQATLREALRFAYGDRRRRQVLMLLSIITFFGVYIQLMPAFTAMRHGNAVVNGLLILFSEVGAVVSSILIANKTADASFARPLRTGLGWAGVLFSFCLAAFCLTDRVVPSMLLMIPTGFAMSAIFSGSQAVLQVEVEDRMRGAFSAMFINFAYFGMLALGGPALGWLAEYFGLTATMCGAAACCLAASIYFLVTDRNVAVADVGR
jgi:MFS family permease